MTDTVDLPSVFWAAIKAGIAPIPLNTLLTPEQWTYKIEDSRADAPIPATGVIFRDASDIYADDCCQGCGARRQSH